MIASEMSRYRVDDMVRGAEASRLARSTRKGRAGQRRAGLRKMGTVVASMALWPVKH